MNKIEKCLGEEGISALKSCYHLIIRKVDQMWKVKSCAGDKVRNVAENAVTKTKTWKQEHGSMTKPCKGQVWVWKNSLCPCTVGDFLQNKTKTHKLRNIRSRSVEPRHWLSNRNEHMFIRLESSTRCPKISLWCQFRSQVPGWNLIVRVKGALGRTPFTQTIKFHRDM